MKSAEMYIRSKRLILRGWHIGDLQGLAAMNADQEVMEYFPATLSYEETIEMYDRLQQHFKTWGYGFFAAELLDTQEFIGFIGLSHPGFDTDFTPCVEMGWRLRKEWWNRGLATEGTIECLNYAFEVLNLDKVYSFTATINHPSKRVMEKIGVENIGTFCHPNLHTFPRLSEHWLFLKSMD